MRRRENGRRSADTKNPDEGRGGKPDAERIAGPARHGEARQGLSELGRIIDAAWHRIRRIFIRLGHEIQKHERRAGGTHRFGRHRGEDLVAETMTVIGLAGGLLIRRRRVATGLGSLLVMAAVFQQSNAIARHHQEGDESREQDGTKEFQTGPPIAWLRRGVKFDALAGLAENPCHLRNR